MLSNSDIRSSRFHYRGMGAAHAKLDHNVAAAAEQDDFGEEDDLA